MVELCVGRRGFLHVTKGNHADSLPDAKTNAGGNTTVKASKTVGVVDVAEGVADSHLLGAVGVLRLGLHLDADNLNGLVPGRETTTNGRGDNLLASAELFLFTLAGGAADTALGETAETEAGAPVGHLANGDGVDTLVDAADALLAVNVHEGGKGGLGGDTGGSHLVLGNLDRLHAGAEAHGGIGLGNTTRHATEDAATEFGGTSGAGIVFGLGRDEEKDSALGGGFDPGPGDETLVDCRRQGVRWMMGDGGAGSIGVVGLQRKDLQPRTPPRDQMRPKAAAKPSPRLAAMVVFVTSRGWPRVVTSNMLRPAPRSKLENLTGFFSNVSPEEADCATATMVVGFEIFANLLRKGCP